MIKKYDFFKTKYGCELLIDLIRLESLEQYIIKDRSHTLSYYDITLITDGKGQFLIDDHCCLVSPKRIIFTAPYQIRHWIIDKVPKGFVLIFEEEFLCSFFNDVEFVKKLSCFNNAKYPPEITISDKEYDFLIDLMEKIEKEICSGKDNHMLRALLYQALAWFDNTYRIKYAIPDTVLQKGHILKFIELVNHDFAQFHSVNYYAGKLCITANHLNDLVKKYSGISAKQHIRNRIVLEAKRMLNFSDLTVAEIAARLNYTDTSYFIRVFRKSVKMTPLEFRKIKNP